MDLCFDSLRVRVWRQLLARFLGDQKQGMVFGVGNLELVGAKRADFFCGGVRVNLQGLGGAARIYFLQGHA